MRCVFLAFAALLALAGCQSVAPLSHAPVAVGFTAEQVQRSLGRPLQIVSAGTDEVWIYREQPGNPNDYIRGGWRRRVTFDPVRRADVVTYEPVDDRLFPNLRTHTTRVTFQAGRVARIDTTADP